MYLYTSEDAGATFTGPTDANPYAGIIGTQDPSGDAIVFGGAVPSIGLISSLQTGGTMFQGVPAGSFTTATANLSLRPDKQDASDGRLGLDGIRPIAAFSDFSGTITVREWTGNGSVNDASQWTTLRLAGADQPRVAGGPKGIALLTEPSTSSGALSVRSIAPGGLSAGPPQVLSKTPARFPTLTADPVSGMFAAAWIDSSDESVHVRTSPDGRVWGPDQLVMRVPGGDLGELHAAATADGGGFVVVRDATGAPTVYDGRILAGQFGATGRYRQAGPRPRPGRQRTAERRSEGLRRVLADPLRRRGHPGHRGVLPARPEEPLQRGGRGRERDQPQRAQHRSGRGRAHLRRPPRPHDQTQGAVRVIAQGAGSAPVTLWHGSLNVTVPSGADVGATLFDFPMDEFAANVEGFGISARAKVVLTKDGVRIPVDLEMPDYFGGITGHAELIVDATSGLHLDTLNFNIADVDIGALEIKDANLQYTSTGDKWDGGATVIVPGPGVTVGAELHFARGAFNGGNFTDRRVPGIPVFSDVFLERDPHRLPARSGRVHRRGDVRLPADRPARHLRDRRAGRLPDRGRAPGGGPDQRLRLGLRDRHRPCVLPLFQRRHVADPRRRHDRRGVDAWESPGR